MSASASEVVRHVENLVRLNEELLSLSERRYSAMASRDATGIESVLADERQVAQAIFDEERGRRQAVMRLGASVGRSGQASASAKLSEVATWIGGATGGRLVELSERLRGLIERTERRNHSATLLAQQMLPHFDELLEILLAGGSAGVSYTSCGRAVRGSVPCMSVLDMQA